MVNVDPGTFASAVEYSNWVDQYNAASPDQRLTMLKEHDPGNDEMYDYLSNNFNLTADRLGSSSSMLSSWFDNLFTGNRDYGRSVYLTGLDQRFNAAEAQNQRDYEERLANTAYQRAAADAKVAGFNPALILGQGGADVPHGAAAYSQHNNYSRSGEGASQLFGSIFRTAVSAMVAMARSSVAAGVAAGAQTGVKAASATISHPKWYDKYISDLKKAHKADRVAMNRQTAADRAELAELEKIFDR